MNRSEKNADDRLLLSKAYDALALFEKYRKPQFLPFLNEHESRFLRENISYRQDVMFFGGYEGAVRVMMGAGAKERDFPVTPLEFSFKEEYTLRHKDFLGALLSLGIDRSVLGDILTQKGRAVVFVKSEIAPFIIAEVQKIGRVGVKIKECDTSSLPVIKDDEQMTLTLSSLRLDAFVSAVTHLSREKSSRLIRSELVTVDHVTEDSVSRILREGDTVTIRKYGKYVFVSDLGFSKKGKQKIGIKHYR